MKEERLSIKDKIIIGLLFLFAFFSENKEMNSIMLYSAVPMAFLLSITNKTGYRKPYFIKGVIVLYAWILFTSIFAINHDAAFSELKKSLGVVLLIFTVYNTAKSEKTLPWLYGVWIIYYFAMIWFAYNLFISGQFIMGEERLASEKFNPNALGYYTFFFTFVVFVLPHIIHSEFWSRFLHITFLLLIPWTFLLAIVGGSRQILLIQIPLFAVLLYTRYWKKEGGLKRSHKVLIVFVLLGPALVGYNRVSDIYSNSILKARSEKSIGEDERTILFNDAVKVGLEHPVFGVGPGNYARLSVLQLYSHNTYSELFANSGFIALLIYILIEVLFLLRQFKRYRRTRDPMFLSFAVFGFFYILDSAFNVFYIVIWLFPVCVLVASHSELYYNKYYKDKKVIVK